MKRFGQLIDLDILADNEIVDEFVQTPNVQSLSFARLPARYDAPTIAPTEVPQITSGSMPSAIRASMTPTCDHPRDAPDPRARPIFGDFGIAIQVCA
jgi:hypothetical protein